MKLRAAVAISSISLGMFACAAEPAEDTDVSEGELQAQLGADATLRCDADNGKAKLALIKTDGKFALLSLTPAADVYALSRRTGALTASASKWSWKGSQSSLAIGANMKGTWEQGSQSTKVTCKMANAETPSWRAANALASYGDEIDGLASTIAEEMQNAEPKAYTVFAIETSKRSSLALGEIAKNTAGALPAEEDDTLLDENDFSYGAMSAAYSLGGGDDYGEWFQGASDGISLMGNVVPALGDTRAGFIAHEKVSALTPVVDAPKSGPSAVELTVGTWTFFLPDAFGK